MTDKEYQSEIDQLQALWDAGEPVEVDAVTDMRRKAIILRLGKAHHAYWSFSGITMEDVIQFGELWSQRIGCDDAWLVGLYNRLYLTAAAPQSTRQPSALK